MKSLSIDIGNTSIKVGFFKNEVLIKTERFKSLEKLLAESEDYYCAPIIVATVAHSTEEIKNKFKNFSKKIIVDKDTPLPIKNGYQTPNTLGFDRLAAAIGANGRFPNENCLIIDIGTAIKYDFIDQNNTFIGGIISPGRQMRFKALHTFTKKLPLLEATMAPDLIGTTTDTCISSGVLNGIAAELNGMIGRYIETYNPKVLLCGGDAIHFETQIKYPTFAAPNLVLEGLNRILLYNVAKS